MPKCSINAHPIAIQAILADSSLMHKTIKIHSKTLGVSRLLPALFGCWMVMLVLAAPPAHAFWPFGDDGMDYAIKFDGADDSMKEWFGELALDQKTEENSPKTLEELEAEASSLSDKAKKALAAKGYMEATAEPRLDAQAEPPTIHIAIEQGAHYTLEGIEILWPGDPIKQLDTTTLRSKVGAPLDMQAVETDAVALHDQIGKDSCLLSLSITPKLQLYSNSRKARAVFTIEHGKFANFGAAVIEGNNRVKDPVITRTIAWKQGDCYQPAKTETTRTRLIESQLFASIEVMPGETPDANGEVPMHINVKERVARSIAAGTQYSTDLGFGVYGSWEHRNLFGEAEKFNSSLTLAENEQALKGTLRIPAFWHERQVLVLSSSLRHQDLDAYEALTLESTAGIERRLSRRLKAGLGVGYSLSQTEDVLTGTNKYALLSFPGFIEYDSRKDIMDPRRGLLARLSAIPYTETIGDGGQFLKLQATGQHYLSSDSIAWKPTLATRASVGSIYGAEGGNVPADIRYYAGGGGSVRGYAYQTLSPYFSGEPIGGSSLVEFSSEVRLRFDEEFGGVLFVDAGNAYASETPNFSEKLYVGVGTGVRYFSPIGPLRFDIAFPLNGKDIGADGYQFYVSLGQAF